MYFVVYKKNKKMGEYLPNVAKIEKYLSHKN